MAGGRAGATIIETVVKDLLGDAAKGVERDVARDGAEAVARDTGRAVEGDTARALEHDAAGTAERDAGKSLKEGEPGKPAHVKSTTDDPIDVATGEVLLAQTDVELPGVLALVIERMHLSSYRQGGLYGISWASTLDQRLELTADGVRYAAPDGTISTYPHAFAPGTAMPPTGGQVRPLTWLGSDGYVIDHPQSGQRLHFPADGGPHGSRLPITAISDRNGNHITFDYDDTGTLVGLRHSGGYRIAIDTDGPAGRKRVTALRLLTAQGDHSGARDEGIVVLRYGYDEAGHLTEIINSSGLPLRYSYDNAGRMTGWRDRNGHEYHYDYDEQGRAVRGYGTDGYLNASLSYDPDGRTTVVTNSLGHQTTYHLNDRHQVIAETNPLGHTTTSEWDERDRLLSRTDPLGRTTRYTYNDHGSVTAVTRPDGMRTSVVYNALNLPGEVTDPIGAVWRQTYDQRGNLVMATDPMGATTTFGYDQRGHLISVRDALGHMTRLQTDAAGLAVSVTDPLGNTTRYRRDAFGRTSAISDPVGGVTKLGWTIEGKPAWRMLPDGAIERWNHDGEGNLTEYLDALGQATQVAYIQFDQPDAETGPDGARLEFTYDTELRLTAVTNPQGLEWRYDYDPAGNLVRETDFNGRVLTYTHDAAGQLIQRRNGVDQTIAYLRDALGNVIEKRAGDVVTTYAYDPAGRLNRAVNSDADVQFQRDPLGRVTAEICNGRILASGYDALGQRIRRRTPSGAESIWQYDPAGRPIILHTSGQTMRFQYDAAGHEIQRTIGVQVALTQTWDASDRMTTQSLWDAPPGSPHQMGLGLPQSARGARLLQHRAYQYRPDGCLAGMHDQATGTRRYDLDPARRVTAVKGNGWSERYAYDAAGNITHADWPASQQLAEPDTDTLGPRAYAGTLIRRAGNVRYEHDAQGRVVLRQHRRLSSKPDTWRYAWDADDRLIAVITPAGQRWRYHYDALGRRIAKKLLGADGRSVVEQIDFVWDETILTEQVSSTQAVDGGFVIRSVAWDYDPDSYRPLSQTERVPRSSAPQEWVDEQFYAIVTDLIGTPTELVNPSGSIAWRAHTNLWGKSLETPQRRSSCPLRFPGQYHDSETDLHYNYYRFYEPTNSRYQTNDPIGLSGGSNPHGYVTNPIDLIDPLGLSPYKAGMEGRGFRPPPGTRSRPPGIPDHWKVKPSKTGNGVWYHDPKNPGNAVRVMPGNPNSPHVNSQSPYVRWQKNGQPLDAAGNVLPTKFSPDAHIPLPSFTFRPELF